MDQSSLEIGVPLAAERPLQAAARHINVSVPLLIDPAVLLRALRTGVVDAEFSGHVRAFFADVDTTVMADLVLGRAVTYPQLADWADRLLPPGHDTRVWLNGRRRY